MPVYDGWIESDEVQIEPDRVRVLRERDGSRASNIVDIRQAIVENLVGFDVCGQLEELGFGETAEVIRDRLPSDKRARSGDLGEVFATEFVEETMSFSVPIRRLRWKVHPNVALPGTDVLGFGEEDGEVTVMKVEAKSRNRLTPNVVANAIEQLEENSGRPKASSIAFVAARLLEIGNEDGWDHVFQAMADGVPLERTYHLVFTFSGNDPCECLTGHEPSDNVRKLAGLYVEDHPEFVREVFEGLDDT